jgi:hypothetical protein
LNPRPTPYQGVALPLSYLGRVAKLEMPLSDRFVGCRRLLGGTPGPVLESLQARGRSQKILPDGTPVRFAAELAAVPPASRSSLAAAAGAVKVAVVAALADDPKQH